MSSIVESEDFNIRYTESSDEVLLRKWLQAKKFLNYFFLSDSSECEEMLRIWIAYSRYKCSLTATYLGVPCGIATLFLMPYTKLAHQSSAYLIVDPMMEGKGVEAALIKNLDHLAKSYFRFERIHYEIYGNNPLEKVLLSQEYQCLFTQERYLKETNRYLCRKVLEKVFS